MCTPFANPRPATVDQGWPYVAGTNMHPLACSGSFGRQAGAQPLAAGNSRLTTNDALSYLRDVKLKFQVQWGHPLFGSPQDRPKAPVLSCCARCMISTLWACYDAYLQDQKDIYDRFLEIMKEFKAQR